MSHPVPGHDYSEQHREESNKEHAARRRKEIASIRHKKDAPLVRLKKMVAEPASKEWFKKYGLPKHNALKNKMLGGSTGKAHRAEKKKYGDNYNDMSGAGEGDR